MTAPDFSIITPSRNQGKFIGETIESVLSQEGDFSIEYLIFDAVSTDETVDIVRRYEKALSEGSYPIRCKDVRFSWVSEKDKGESDAVNKGFRKANGRILSFTSSDDCYEPGSFALAYAAFAADPALDLVYGDMYMLTEETGQKTRYRSKQMDLTELTTSLTRVPKPSAFFTKRIIGKVGPLDENLHYTLDYDLWVRIFKEGKVRYLPEALSTFRIQKQSKSTDGPDRFIREIDRIHKKYGLSVINTKKIQHITSTNPVFIFARSHLPMFYRILKRLYYGSRKGKTYAPVRSGQPDAGHP